MSAPRTVRRRLLENTASLSVLQVANLLLPLLTVPYLLRVLGPDRAGLVALSQAFAAYFAVITDYGFNLSATRRVATVRDDPRALDATFGAVLGTKLLLLVLSAAVAAAVVAGVPRFRAEWPVYAASFLAVAGGMLFPLWFFQGMERMRLVAGLHLVSRAVTTAAIFLLVRGPGDYVACALIQSSGVLIAGAAALALARSVAPIRPRMPSWGDVAEQLRDGWHLFLSTAAVSLYTTSNTFLLGVLVDNAAVAYFSAADKLVKAGQAALSPVTQAIYPHVSATAARSRDAALAFLRRVLWWLGGGTLVVSLAVLALSGPVVRVLYGAEFHPSVAVLRWMALIPFVTALSNVFGVQTLLTFGYKREFSRVVFAGGLLNLALLVVLAPRLGARGAAIAVLATECAVTTLFYVAVRRAGFAYRAAAA